MNKLNNDISENLEYNDVLVYICCITYNHAKFIRQALDSFLMQKTNFPFKIIVHDDASTDDTANIIREYAEKYPNIIMPIFQTENQWSKGKKICKNFVFPLVNGKYVALCEGDDYWTDPYKLQKQVDFMEAHPDFSICFHPVKVIWEDKRIPDSIFPSRKKRHYKTILTFNDLVKENFMQTNSVIYRWRFNKDNLNLIPDDIFPGDWFLHLLHAQVGKIGFLNDVMAVYRKHSGGVWYSAGYSDNWYIENGYRLINFHKMVEKTFNVSKEHHIYYLVLRIYYASIKTNNTKLQKTLEQKYTYLPKPNKYRKINLIYIIILRLFYIITFKHYKAIKMKYKILKAIYRKNFPC